MFAAKSERRKEGRRSEELVFGLSLFLGFGFLLKANLLL
jgi:hypothetical protein